MYTEFFGNPAIILSSAKAAVDLVEKRSAKYSDRPPFSYFNELCVTSVAVDFTSDSLAVLVGQEMLHLTRTARDGNACEGGFKGDLSLDLPCKATIRYSVARFGNFCASLFEIPVYLTLH